MRKYVNTAKNIILTIALPASLFLISHFIYPDRIDLRLLWILMLQAIPMAILAWGLCFEIKIGLWDFSVGAVVLISGIIGGNLANMLNLGVIGVVILCPVVGLLGGLLTGSMFALLRIPSIIVSIGMMLVYESFSGLIFGGKGVMAPGDVFALASFPQNVIIGLIAFSIAYALFNLRRIGFHVRAVGNGVSVAKMNGIDINKVRIMCFAISGFFAGTFSFMQLGGSGVMTAQSNMTTMGMVIDAIICVCIALSLEKVTNLIVGVFIGSITTQIIKVFILVSGFPSMYQQVVIAIFLLLFMGISFRSDILKSVSIWLRGLFRKKALG